MLIRSFTCSQRGAVLWLMTPFHMSVRSRTFITPLQPCDLCILTSQRRHLLPCVLNCVCVNARRVPRTHGKMLLDYAISAPRGFGGPLVAPVRPGSENRGPAYPAGRALADGVQKIPRIRGCPRERWSSQTRTKCLSKCYQCSKKGKEAILGCVHKLTYVSQSSRSPMQVKPESGGIWRSSQRGRLFLEFFGGGASCLELSTFSLGASLSKTPPLAHTFPLPPHNAMVSPHPLALDTAHPHESDDSIS